LQRALGLLSGPLAVGVMFHDQPERLFAVQRGVPLHWNSGPSHVGWSSDASALIPGTSGVTPLREAQVLEIYPHEDGVHHQVHA